MPIQRERPRERSQRFSCGFLEIFDMMNNVQILLAICSVFLIIGLRQKRGIPSLDLIIAVLFLRVASAVYDESLKKPVSARPKKGSKRLRFTDYNTERRNQSFYQRFRFRQEHFQHFMIVIDLPDADTGEFKRIKLDRHRHYDTAMMILQIFLGHLASPATYVTMMDEFGMDEKQLSASFNCTCS